MFEALVITKSEKRGARSLASLPAAAAAHALLLGTWYIYALYAPEAIKAPLAILRFSEPPPIAIPVKVVPRQQIDQVKQASRRDEEAPRQEIQAPIEPPAGIQPPGHDATDEAQGPTIEPGFIAVEGLPPGEADAGFANQKPPLLHDYNLAVTPEVVSQVQPEYPAALRAMGVEGRAVIKITIGAEGGVDEAEVVTATNPLFGQAALEAVKRWRFTKSSDDSGAPVRVIKIVTVNFRLH